MTSEWTPMTLGELCTKQGGRIQTGPFGSQLHTSDYVDQGIPVVMPTNIISSGISVEGIARIQTHDVERLSQHKLSVGDIVFSRRGDVTKNALVRASQAGWLCGTGCLKVRVGDESLASAKFLSYCLRHPEIVEWLVRHAVGATMPNLNTDILSRVPLTIPSTATQKKVVAILDGLTESIQVLQQQNTALEAIAQRIFRSWFVDFDPVHAKAAGMEPEGMSAELAALFPSEFEECELGPIPKGWKAGLLGEVAVNARQQVKPDNLNKDTHYVGLEHVERKSLSLINWATAEAVASGKFKFNKSDILFGKLRPYFHKVAVAPIDGVCSTDILIIRPVQDIWHGFVTLSVFSTQFIEYATQLSDGARMPRTNWSDTAKYRVAIPSEGLAKKFDEHWRPIMKTMNCNVHLIRCLAELRDHLLPRLISGKLSLEEAEQAIGEAVKVVGSHSPA